MNALNFTLLIAVFFLTACRNDISFKSMPKGPVKHHLIVLAKVQDGVRVRGFSGATPASTEIFCEVDKINHKSKSSADGSFIINLDRTDQNARFGECTYTVAGKPYRQPYEIRKLDSALKNIAHDAFPTDKEVDSMDFNENVVSILSSNASLLRTFGVDKHWVLEEKPKATVLLNQTNAVSLDPTAITRKGDFSLVSLFKTNELALIDHKKNAVIYKDHLKDTKDQLFRINLATPLTIASAIDADESGALNKTISRSIARNPEAVLALDDRHYLASFVNYYQFEEKGKGLKAVVGPGIVALLSLDNDKLKTEHIEILPYKNPRHFLKKDDNTVWVTCAGEYHEENDGIFGSVDAGLVRLKLASSLKSMSVDHKIPLNDYTPAEPALIGSTLIIPRWFKNEIAILDEAAFAIFPQKDIKVPNFSRNFQFTFAEHWHDDIVFLGDNQGSLVTYSLSDGFFPFPFIEPIVLNKSMDKRVALYPQKMFFRHKVINSALQTDYPSGYNAWVLAPVLQKIFPLDFLAVFGP